ncbi:hypothetical protein ABSP78_004334 [Salmonella enterica subsp. enterica serovar 1,4,[5],12:i:-]|nr:hypothetical protein [Salmonella enterica]EBP0126065.1 hypothetical protein [Salmonella enterica]EFD5185068.1 hypothetical protein [Escherichia coli]
MSGNGGDNAHNNAFGGGKNPGMGNSGTGSHSGSAGGAGNKGNGGGANVGHGGSMDIDMGNGMTMHVDGAHAVSPGKDSGIPWGGGSGHGNNGGNSDSHQGGSASGGNSTGSSGGHVPTTWERTANYYSSSDRVSRKALKNMYEKAVRTGSIPKEARGKLRENVQKMLDEDKAKAEAKKKEEDAVKDAVSKVADFYKELSSKYGEKLAKEARDLAEEARGKTLRNSKEAIEAFNKYKDILNKKFSVADREAIAKALESLDKNQMAKQLATYGKAFGVVGGMIQWGSFINGLIKGFRTGDWNDALIGGENIVAGKLAAALVTVAFSAMAVAPIGIFGFALIMAVTSALITDRRLQQLNDFIKGL